MRLNKSSEEIEAESGYSPNRSYYCIFCDGWHVTSGEKMVNVKSKTEKLVELYRQEKAKKAQLNQEKAEKLQLNQKKAEKAQLNQEQAEKIQSNAKSVNRNEELKKHFKIIEEHVRAIENIKGIGYLYDYNEIFVAAFAELETAKNILGRDKMKETIEKKLNTLWNEVDANKTAKPQ